MIPSTLTEQSIPKWDEHHARQHRYPLAALALNHLSIIFLEPSHKSVVLIGDNIPSSPKGHPRKYVQEKKENEIGDGAQRHYGAMQQALSIQIHIRS